MPTAHVKAESHDFLQEIAESLWKSKKIVVVTGAGISTNSGIPDFRSENGLYAMIQSQFEHLSRRQLSREDSSRNDAPSDDTIEGRSSSKRRKLSSLTGSEISTNMGSPVQDRGKSTQGIGTLDTTQSANCSRAPWNGSSQKLSSNNTRNSARDQHTESPAPCQAHLGTSKSVAKRVSEYKQAVGTVMNTPISAATEDTTTTSSWSDNTCSPDQEVDPAAQRVSQFDASSPLSSPPPILFDPYFGVLDPLASDGELSPALDNDSGPASQHLSHPLITTQFSKSSRRSLQNLKGRDLFDASIWSDPLRTSVFYTFITNLRQKSQQATPTACHAFLRCLRDHGKLVRCYTQNIDRLESKIGLSCSLLLGPGAKTRFSTRKRRAQIQSGLKLQVNCGESSDIIDTEQSRSSSARLRSPGRSSPIDTTPKTEPDAGKVPLVTSLSDKFVSSQCPNSSLYGLNAHSLCMSTNSSFASLDSDLLSTQHSDGFNLTCSAETAARSTEPISCSPQQFGCSTGPAGWSSESGGCSTETVGCSTATNPRAGSGCNAESARPISASWENGPCGISVASRKLPRPFASQPHVRETTCEGCSTATGEAKLGLEASVCPGHCYHRLSSPDLCTTCSTQPPRDLGSVCLESSYAAHRPATIGQYNNLTGEVDGASEQSPEFAPAKRESDIGGPIPGAADAALDPPEASRDNIVKPLAERGPGLQRDKAGPDAQRDERDPGEQCGGQEHSKERREGPDSGVECVLLHGSLDVLRCFLCGQNVSWDEDGRESLTMQGGQPGCPYCQDVAMLREEKGKRALGVGKLRPDIVLYGEEHPDSQRISEVVQHDLGLGPEMMVILGTSLRVHGLKVMIREFARAIHTKGGIVVFVNYSKPSDSLWSDVIDFWVEMDCDSWVADLRQRKPLLWDYPAAGETATKKRHQNKMVLKRKATWETKGAADVHRTTPQQEKSILDRPTAKRPMSIRDHTLNGANLTQKILRTLGCMSGRYTNKIALITESKAAIIKRKQNLVASIVGSLNPRVSSSQVSHQNQLRPSRAADVSLPITGHLAKSYLPPAVELDSVSDETSMVAAVKAKARRRTPNSRYLDNQVPSVRHPLAETSGNIVLPSLRSCLGRFDANTLLDYDESVKLPPIWSTASYLHTSFT